jgi:hypothetical protein
MASKKTLARRLEDLTRLHGEYKQSQTRTNAKLFEISEALYREFPERFPEFKPQPACSTSSLPLIGVSAFGRTTQPDAANITWDSAGYATIRGVAFDPPLTYDPTRGTDQTTTLKPRVCGDQCQLTASIDFCQLEPGHDGWHQGIAEHGLRNAWEPQ